MERQGTLVVILGPTGVGKTAAAIAVARDLNAEIISADSRQIFRGIPIGTAAPTAEELAAVPHHFVGFKDLEEYYSAAQFESDVMELLPRLFSRSPYVVMCGGSMLYIDAVCRGIDEIPTISPEVRDRVIRLRDECGIEGVAAQLELLDPEYMATVDRSNTKRLMHALEICFQSGRSYTSLRTGRRKERPFRIVKIGLDMPREELFARINRRVDVMMEQGLEAEARSVYSRRHLNSLNTVGYKELFAYFDNLAARSAGSEVAESRRLLIEDETEPSRSFEWAVDLTTVAERIKKNTRVYAKKQLTWFHRDMEIHWMDPRDTGLKKEIEKWVKSDDLS